MSLFTSLRPTWNGFHYASSAVQDSQGELSPRVVAKVSIRVVSVVEIFKREGGWSRLHVSCVHSIASTTVVLLSFTFVPASKDENACSPSR